MTIEQRIEALERRCKRLGKTLMGVGTLALFAVVAGTAGWTVAYTGHISPESITTKRIYLKNSAGKTRVVLLGQTGSVHAYDRAGKMRVWLDGSGGRIRAYDRAGTSRVSIGGGNGSIYLYDSARTSRVRLLGSTGRIAFKAPGDTQLSYPPIPPIPLGFCALQFETGRLPPSMFGNTPK